MGHHDVVKPVIGNDGVGVSQAGADVLRAQPGIVVDDRLGSFALCQQTRISSTEMRMPRTTGFPLKMAGSLVIRSSWPMMVSGCLGGVVPTFSCAHWSSHTHRHCSVVMAWDQTHASVRLGRRAVVPP